MDESEHRYNYFFYVIDDPKFATWWIDLVVNRSDKLIFDQEGDLARGSRSRGNLGIGLEDVRDKVRNEGLMYALPFADMFDPIFVDFRGQDGYWYAGFTGVVTRIGDSYARTGDQSITIQCKDYTALLDNVSLISGWNRFSLAETFSNTTKFLYSTEANVQAGVAGIQNVFSDYDKAYDIIRNVVKDSQDMFCVI